MPELRFLLSLNKIQTKKYLSKAPPKVIRCLYEVALNIVYGHKSRNGFDITPGHVKSLKKHKRTLTKLVKTRNLSAQRRLLKKGGVAVSLLLVLGSVISTLAALL